MCVSMNMCQCANGKRNKNSFKRKGEFEFSWERIQFEKMHTCYVITETSYLSFGSPSKNVGTKEQLGLHVEIHLQNYCVRASIQIKYFKTNKFELIFLNSTKVRRFSDAINSSRIQRNVF